MRIDPHVHCEDDKIAHTFKLANSQGVQKIFDTPLILWRKDVIERLKLVPIEQKGNYFLYIGLTTNEKQIEQAVQAYDEFPEVIGFKLFAGESVGDLAVTDEEDQRKIYKKLTALGYKGVIAVYCEKKSLLKPELWDPNNPISHSFARPRKAEIEAVKDQLLFVRNTGFQGTLYIVRVSCLGSVEWIDSHRRWSSVTCGVTPHHIMWDNRQLSTPDGLIYKMNPPLRDRVEVVELTECLKAGLIDWIETDHASHPISEKSFPPYLSGYPSLCLYKHFVEEFLPSIGVKKKLIQKMTCDNICTTFGLKKEVKND